MLKAAQKFSNKKSETNYQLSKQQNKTINCTCHLCKRAGGEILGPFTKQGGSQ